MKVNELPLGTVYGYVSLAFRSPDSTDPWLKLLFRTKRYNYVCNIGLIYEPYSIFRIDSIDDDEVFVRRYNG
jgi:hypothetical protein